MTQMKTMMAAVAAVFLLATTALAEDGKSYIGFSAGPSVFADSSLTDSTGDSIEASYSSGVTVSAVLGRKFDSGVRFEGEINYRTAEMDRLSYGGSSVKVTCDVASVSTLANLYFDIKNSSPITPYVGAGIGLSRVYAGAASVNGIRIWEEDDDLVFAYQIAAGVGFDISKDVTVDLGYKYFATSDPQFELLKADYSSHNFMAGIRLNF